MKRVIIRSQILIILLTLTISSFSCNRKKKRTTEIDPINTENQRNETGREPVVFIAGEDTDNSSFYKNATSFFEKKKFEVITDVFSLQEIILWLNNNHKNILYKDIHIVSKRNLWEGMDLKTKMNGEKIKENTLRNELEEISKLQKVISENTNIIFHVSELGNSPDLVRTLKEIFSVEGVSPNLITTKYVNVFGGKFSAHFLAKPYYRFYPTENPLEKVDELSKEFSENYTNEEIDWQSALRNEKESSIGGDPYTIQFNIPAKWELDYTDSEETIPVFELQEKIINWIKGNEELSKELSMYNIPIEKFKWKFTSTTEGKLVIEGITTVVSILKPLTSPHGDVIEYIIPEINNSNLYTVE